MLEKSTQDTGATAVEDVMCVGSMECAFFLHMMQVWLLATSPHISYRHKQDYVLLTETVALA